MYHQDKQETPQQWSVHAEVTISHNPSNDGNNSTAPQAGVTHTEQSGNGLRMVYTWTSHPPESEYNNYRSSAPPSTTVFPNSDTTSRSSAQSFQRGGLVFTSVPPRQTNPFDHPNRLNVQDSGYNSELLSPSSCGPTSFSRRPIIPYNRRCRSTCSIILSTAFNADGHNLKCDTSALTQPVSYHQCGRTQSLRCQTPSIKPERRDSYFGCGDPWCYHADDLSQRRCSPVLESCEECSLSNQSVSSNKRASRANTFTTHFCTRVPERNRSSPPTFDYRSKDMASQTVQTSEKCTSPFEKMSMSPFGQPQREQEGARRKSSRKLSDKRRRSSSNSRRNSDNTLSPSTLPTDNADNKKSSKRITRSPAVQRGISPLLDKKSPIRDTEKKQRTVHIDVYCTGSDCESESESDTDSEEGTQSSPQTVFESEKVRLSHRRAGSGELPYSLRNFIKENIAGGTIQDEQRRKLANKLPIKRNSDSDEEVSTAYPSALSSYSQIRDFESSLSSVPPSWSAMSTSSCTVPDGYDSFAATSCKDTVSDFENLVLRKFSLAPDESEYFIPRRLQSTDTGTDDMQDRASTASILPSDSFEYDDSADRERIKLMEQMWRGGDPDLKTWKSPSSERKYMLQQQKMKEYLEKRVKEKPEPKTELKESETESTEDDSERGWSFVRSTDQKTGLKRDGTVRRASKDALEDDDQKSNSNENKSSVKKKNNDETVPKIQESVKKSEQVPSLKNNKNSSGLAIPPSLTTTTTTTTTTQKTQNTQNVDNIENTKSPSQLFTIQPSSSCTVIGLQRFDSKVRTPFTILPGKYTEPLFKAQKFGTVIGAIRKPGHHVGPAKNPDCLCDHCKRFYEDSQTRGRTRSVGDNSTELNYNNWRELLKPRITLRKNVVSDF